MILEGNLIDVHQRRTYPVRLTVTDGRIAAIEHIEQAPTNIFLAPGLVDAHIHIESSMLPPAEFGRQALRHGTLSTVSDPHEIANVLGLEGVRYMVEQARQTPLQIHLGAPSCVPATAFETAGAHLGLAETRTMLEDMDLPYLAEMMNWPGVLHQDAEVMAKIALAKSLGKPVDGHAPGLRGSHAAAYAAAGISTDHECFTLEEAEEKLALGMKILIREGSAARNLEALHPIIASHPGHVMLCSDDKHPDELLQGHINLLVMHLLGLGYGLFDILEAAVLVPVSHYNLQQGMLRVGDMADFLILSSPEDWQEPEVYVAGTCVARYGECLLPYVVAPIVNQFRAEALLTDAFTFPGVQDGWQELPVIQARDGQIVTGRGTVLLQMQAGLPWLEEDAELALITVVNRYMPGAVPAMALISGFGLRAGALASSVAHDSHNIVAISRDVKALVAAVNQVITYRGGLAVLSPDGAALSLELPIAGLMSDRPAEEVASAYSLLDAAAKGQCGCTVQAPFMLLSFMALLVIPSLKLSDLGLFDGDTFAFVSQGRG